MEYPDLRFESAWEFREREDIALLFLVFSGRVFACGGHTLDEVESLPSEGTQIPFRDDSSNRDFDRPPTHFVGASIENVATFDGDDRWVFLRGGNLIFWWIGGFASTYTRTRFLDDSERDDWNIDLTISDLHPTPIRFLGG
ncbi:MAG TPA: hypothetical protein VGN57_13500 [Pirellulaceae bacterium]|nr:hypothetical protein [Pirellulaceae bacterium]